jgi:hypothetical protein
MRRYTNLALLALALASAPAFAQDRGPGSPNAPNTGNPGTNQPSPREEALRNCDKLNGMERDNCIRDFQARTGSRTEPSAPAATPQNSDMNKGGGTTPR